MSAAVDASATRGRMPALDMLRGIAILAVMLRHGFPEVFPAAGIVGVVLFFVLSGYLITGLLLRDLSSSGRIRYGRFYAHRAFRLLPALFAFVAIYAVAELLTDALGDRSAGTIDNTVVAALTYIKDFPLPFDVSQAIAPLWTLAVEEQFYLIWPLLLAWAFRRHLTRRLILVASATVFIVMVSSVIGALIVVPDKFNQVYSLPTTWGIGLVIGSAIRIYRDRALAWLGRGRRRATLVALSAVSLTALCFVPDAIISPIYFVLGGLAIVVAGSIIVLAGSQRQSPISLTAPLLFLGKISYAAYLWNYAIVLWLNNGSAVDVPPATAAGSMVLTVTVAVISWHTVEAVGRRGRERFDTSYTTRSRLGAS